MPHLISLTPITPEEQQLLAEAGSGWNIICGKANELDEATLLSAEVMYGWSSSLNGLLEHPDLQLKWVQSWSAGVDKLPLQALEQRGIIVTDASGVHPNPMSEHVLAYMLALTRNVHTAIRNQQAKVWQKEAQLPEMHGATAVIIGAGTIGTEVARLLQAFGMTVLGIRRTASEAPYFDKVGTTAELAQFLGESDYVINLLPLTDETRGMFAAEQFEAMKQGAYFINVGRGETVRTDDLVQALQSGKLGGAGLDVYEVEPLPPAHKLWELGNVILTPHTGGSTYSYMQRLTKLLAYNLGQYTAGQPLRNQVNYREGY